MAALTPAEQPEKQLEPIKGRDWSKEVGTVSGKREFRERRQKFYLERAKFKLQTESFKLKTQQDLENLSQDPSKAGLLTLNDLELTPGTVLVKVGPRVNLSTILKGYFEDAYKTKNIDHDRRQIEREIALTYYWLTCHTFDTKNRPFNTDLLRDGETVKIEGGKLSIIKPNGEKRLHEVFLRAPKET